MGFYIEAKNEENRPVAAIGYQVWNPNVKHVYRILEAGEIDSLDWSGNKKDKVYSYDDIKCAIEKAEKLHLSEKVETSELHPIIAMFTQLQQSEIDPDKEKEKIIHFLNRCLDITKEEGEVTINFG